MAAEATIGRRFSVRGRVQGVGFRDFAQREARRLNITGYARNLPDGSVLIYAVGLEKSVKDLESMLRKGPRWAEVREVEVEETTSQDFGDFRVFP